MSPGPKKKNTYRRSAGDSQQDRNNLKKNAEPQNDKEEDLTTAAVNEATEDFGTEVGKYSKRSVKSNWNKYEESTADPFADKMRGDDFEVILSYSGGSGSQLQLQDEKDWDETYINEKDITLDFENLALAIKCIPFHKRIPLSSDIFDNKQILKFISSAESYTSSYSLKASVIEENTLGKKSTEPDLNIVENAESTDSEEIPVKPYLFEEKTENIIQSITSGLSFKSLAEEKEKDEPPVSKEEREIPKGSDDLDFLLSLNISVTEEKPAPPKDNFVDDWLNSILDD